MLHAHPTWPQENPKEAQHHLRQPEIMRKLNKLVAAGIIQMK